MLSEQRVLIRDSTKVQLLLFFPLSALRLIHLSPKKDEWCPDTFWCCKLQTLDPVVTVCYTHFGGELYHSSKFLLHDLTHLMRVAHNFNLNPQFYTQRCLCIKKSRLSSLIFLQWPWGLLWAAMHFVVKCMPWCHEITELYWLVEVEHETIQYCDPWGLFSRRIVH
jgi:hypothetical protein